MAPRLEAGPLQASRLYRDSAGTVHAADDAGQYRAVGAAPANVVLLTPSLTPAVGQRVYQLWHNHQTPGEDPVPVSDAEGAPTMDVPPGWSTLNSWLWTGNHAPQEQQNCLLFVDGQSQANWPSVYAGVDPTNGHFIPIELPGLSAVMVGCGTAEYSTGNTLYTGVNNDDELSGGSTSLAPAEWFEPSKVSADDVLTRTDYGGLLSGVDRLSQALDRVDNLADGAASVGMLTTQVVHPQADLAGDIWMDGIAGFAGDFLFAPGSVDDGPAGSMRSKRVDDDFRTELQYVAIDDMPEGRGGSFGPVYKCASGRYALFVHSEEDNSGHFYSRLGVAMSDNLVDETPTVTFLGDILESGIDMETAAGIGGGINVDMWSGSFVVHEGFIYVMHKDGHPGGFGIQEVVAMSRCTVEDFETAIDAEEIPPFVKFTATGWDGDPIGGLDAVTVCPMFGAMDPRWADMIVLPNGSVAALLSRHGVQQIWAYAKDQELTDWAIAGVAQPYPGAETTERLYSTIIPTDWDIPWTLAHGPVEVLNLWSTGPVEERWDNAFIVLSSYVGDLAQPAYQLQVSAVAPGIDPLDPPTDVLGSPRANLAGYLVLVPDGATPGVWQITATGPFVPVIVDPPWGYTVALITQFSGPVYGLWTATQAGGGTEWVRVGPTTVPDGSGDLGIRVGAKPTVELGTGAGTGATFTNEGTDTMGFVETTTGILPTGGEVIAFGTFELPYSHGAEIAIVPANVAAGALVGTTAQPVAFCNEIEAGASDQFVIQAGDALVSATTYRWIYIVMPQNRPSG